MGNKKLVVYGVNAPQDLLDEAVETALESAFFDGVSEDDLETIDKWRHEDGWDNPDGDYVWREAKGAALDYLANAGYEFDWDFAGLSFEETK